MRSPDELTDLFRARGLKVTPQRQCIFGVLHDSSAHPTAEAVHADVVEHMPTVSLRTVYQTLNDLAAMGELVSLDLGTGSTRFDPTLDPHHHMVCDRCGRIHDLHAAFGEVAVPEGAAGRLHHHRHRDRLPRPLRALLVGRTTAPSAAPGPPRPTPRPLAAGSTNHRRHTHG